MAGSVNKVILVGHLGADPEVRHTPSGHPVANFRIATSDNWTDKQGERRERTEWHRIVVWGKLAELCGEHLAKGRLVYVEGRIETRQWDDRDGNTRYTTEVQARSVTFLGGRGDAPVRTSTQPTAEPGPDLDYGPPPLDDDNVPF